MLMRRKCFLCTAVIMLCMLCSCVSIPKSLSVVQSEDVEIVLQRGSTVGSVDNGDLTFSIIGNTVLDGEGSFVLGITNKAPSTYSFDDADVTIYGGYSDTESNWKLIGTWNAEKYYDDAESEYRSQVFWTGFAGALNTINASMGSYSSSYVSTPYGSAYVSTRTYNPGAVAAASYMAQANTNAVARSGKEYLKFLESYLLFDSMVMQNDSYIGWVYFNLNRESYSYFKIEIKNTVTQKTSTFILKMEGNE
jgi:hypothetical protein